jgi:3-oxoacyl-[acyl-carrier-protein] synthase II
MRESDVVITAQGIVSAWGTGVEAFAAGLRSGRCALRVISGLPTSARLAGTVPDFEAASMVPPSRRLREFDRTSLLLAGATALALESGSLCVSGRDDVGLVVGSTFGTISSIMHFDLEALREGPMYVSPLAFPNTVLNAPAGRVAGLFDIRGVSATLSTGETSGIDALAYATDWLRAGRAVCVLGGSGFGLSPSLADAFPAVLGEGAAIFVLESFGAARARDARPRARVGGLGTAFLPRSRDGAELATAALSEALAAAGALAGEVDVVIAGGRGPAHAPGLEAEVLERVFGGARPPVRSLTAYVGDCLDASSGLAIAAALAAIEEGARRALVSSLSRAGLAAFLVLEADGTGT